MGRIVILLLSLLLLNSCKSNPDLSSYFDQNIGCFVLFDVQNNELVKYNNERCAERFSPCSTFKIPNSLIALEAGIFDDVDSLLKWDSTSVPRRSWWPEKWAGDQSLRTALKNSVVWFYQLIALQVEKKNYEFYLNKFNYGNKDISGPLYKFWLVSSLKISADEQIDFLKQFYNTEFDCSRESIDLVKEIIVLEETSDYKFYGKTGGGDLSADKFIGWLVGFVENDNGHYFYAMNVEGKTFKEVADKRLSITKNILHKLGVLNHAERLN